MVVDLPRCNPFIANEPRASNIECFSDPISLLSLLAPCAVGVFDKCTIMGIEIHN